MRTSLQKLNAIYDDPWKELAYRVLERACLDARGKEMCLPLDERTYAGRVAKMNEAREWLDSNEFELYCYGLNIDPEYLRKKLPKEKITVQKPKSKIDERTVKLSKIAQLPLSVEYQGV